MKAPQRIKTIQSRIASSFVMLVLFTALLLIFISYRLSESAVRETAESYTSEPINQVNANIQTYITGMKDISLAAMNNPNVREYLASADELQPAELAILKAKISEYFHSIRVTMILMCGACSSGSSRPKATASSWLPIALLLSPAWRAAG